MMARSGGIAILLGMLVVSPAAFAQKPSAPSVPQATNPIPRDSGQPSLADSLVQGMVRLFQYAESEEVVGAERTYFESLRETRAPGCTAPISYSDVGNQTLSLTFSASDRLEFPEGADRPVNATWGRAYDVDYCGTTHREHVAFRVRNNGPITTGPGVASPTSAGTNTGRAVVGQNNRRRRSPPDHEYTYPGDDEDDIF